MDGMGDRRVKEHGCKGARCVVELVLGLLAWGAPGPKRAVAAVPVVDGHRSIQIGFSVTNELPEEQRVAKVQVSCPCLKADLHPGLVLAPGETASFRVLYRAPWTGDGMVHESVAVTLVPSGVTVEYPVEVEVRNRLGFDPPEAVFGVVEPGEEGRELEVRLAGYAAGNTVLEGVEGGHAFSVRVGEDRRSLKVRLAGARQHPGLYAEMWMIKTGDPEMPVLNLPVTARVTGKTEEGTPTGGTPRQTGFDGRPGKASLVGEMEGEVR